MSSKLLMNFSEDYQDWWEKTWREREELFKQLFGETSPPGQVSSFQWDDLELMIPGGCAMTFPPQLPDRPRWLTISHGLTQPLEPNEKNDPESASGYGYEFGFLTYSSQPWCINCGWQLMTYLKQSERYLGRGHRVPMWFSLGNDGSFIATLGKPSLASEAAVFGQMRGAILWPYLAHPGGFTTTTGYFSILVGTTITQDEWALAKATSTAHLLLLLFEADIGQTSDVGRGTVIMNDRWQARWDELRCLTDNDVDEMLLQYRNRSERNVEQGKRSETNGIKPS